MVLRPLSIRATPKNLNFSSISDADRDNLFIGIDQNIVRVLSYMSYIQMYYHCYGGGSSGTHNNSKFLCTEELGRKIKSYDKGSTGPPDNLNDIVRNELFKEITTQSPHDTIPKSTIVSCKHPQ